MAPSRSRRSGYEASFLSFSGEAPYLTGCNIPALRKKEKGMNPQVREIARMLQPATSGLSLGRGVATAVDTVNGVISVQVAGMPTSITGVKFLSSYQPQVNDQVIIAKNGSDWWVLGELGKSRSSAGATGPAGPAGPPLHCGYGTLQQRPAADAEGAELYYATDVNGGSFFRTDGATWSRCGPGLALEEAVADLQDAVALLTTQLIALMNV